MSSDWLHPPMFSLTRNVASPAKALDSNGPVNQTEYVLQKVLNPCSQGKSVDMGTDSRQFRDSEKVVNARGGQIRCISLSRDDVDFEVERRS